MRFRFARARTDSSLSRACDRQRAASPWLAKQARSSPSWVGRRGLIRRAQTVAMVVLAIFWLKQQRASSATRRHESKRAGSGLGFQCFYKQIKKRDTFRLFKSYRSSIDGIIGIVRVL